MITAKCLYTRHTFSTFLHIAILHNNNTKSGKPVKKCAHFSVQNLTRKCSMHCMQHASLFRGTGFKMSTSCCAVAV